MDKFLFPAGPMQNVYLLNGYKVLPEPYGGVVRYENLTRLLDAIIEGVVLKPARLSGQEVAYLRETLDCFQAELGQLLGVDEQTVSLWERDKYAISLACDVLLRRHVIDALKVRFTKLTRKKTVAELSGLAVALGSYDLMCEFADGFWHMSYAPRASVYRMSDPVYQTMKVPVQANWDCILRDRLLAQLRLKSTVAFLYKGNHNAQHEFEEWDIGEFKVVAAEDADDQALNVYGDVILDTRGQRTMTLRGSVSSKVYDTGVPQVERSYADAMIKLSSKEHGKAH